MWKIAVLAYILVPITMACLLPRDNPISRKKAEGQITTFDAWVILLILTVFWPFILISWWRNG